MNLVYRGPTKKLGLETINSEQRHNKKSPGRNPGRVLNPISYEKPDEV